MLHQTPHKPISNNPVVTLEHVSCGYGNQTVLKDINLQVRHGDFIGLLGPSGSGKTTLLRIIMGAADLHSGRVLIDSVPVSKKRPPIGYVPQLETIDWNFPVTVKEVVLMGNTMNNPFLPWHSKNATKTANDLMEKLGIKSLAKRHIRHLSGGQQQRVFLARAMLSNPKLLLLDEPTAGIDIKTRDDVMHLLHDLNHQGVTIIMTTHEINSVAAHLPWVVCINGQILSEGPPTDVFTSEILSLTYGSPMPVIQYEGLSLVAERPHTYEMRDGQGKHTEPHTVQKMDNARTI